MIDILYREKDWDKALMEIGNYDFYHTYGYHKVLSKEKEEPILIVYEEEKIKIALPFVKRKVNNEYYDLTSVHGYLGPVSLGIDSSFKNEKFKSQFETLLVSEKIVSAFSKLNPFIRNQNMVLKGLGQIECIGELIYFNQQMDDETQKSHYNKNTRRTLKKLQEMATVEENKSPEDIAAFVQLYHNTMDRLNAKTLFYFGQDYFEQLMDSKLFDCKILSAKHRETKDIIAAGFISCSGEICHLELMATNEEYFKYGPSRIIYDEARRTMKSSQIKYLVLGGGTGGREGSLMRFKSSFTQNYIDHTVWKYIAIPEIYDTIQTVGQKNSDSSFFPKYRLVE